MNRKVYLCLAILAVVTPPALGQIDPDDISASGSVNLNASRPLLGENHSESCTASIDIESGIIGDNESCQLPANDVGSADGSVNISGSLIDSCGGATASLQFQGAASAQLGEPITFDSCTASSSISFGIDFTVGAGEDFSITFTRTQHPANESRFSAQLTNNSTGTSFGSISINTLGSSNFNSDTLQRSGATGGNYSLRGSLQVVSIQNDEPGSNTDQNGTGNFNLGVDVTVGNSTFHWINPSGGTYNVGSNWNPACIPVDDGVRHDIAVFDLNTGSSTPVNAAAATAGQWQFSNGTYALTGPAEVFGLANDPTSLQVTNGAHMRWTSGTLTAGEAVQIGLTPGSLSFLDVTGATSSLVNDNVMTIENALLDISNGGRVATEFMTIGGFQIGPSRLRVAGLSAGTRSSLEATSELNIVGGGGFAGEVSVLDGALIQSGDIAVLDGTALVKGSSTPNSPSDAASFAKLSANGSLTVGGEGSGRLTIEKGGAAIGRTVFVDAVGTGTGKVVVDGQGEFAVLTALDSLTVVATEQVEVEVKNGGVLDTQSVNLGSTAALPGAADLTIRGRTSSNVTPSRLRVFDLPTSFGPAGLTAVGGTAEGQLNILEGASASLGGGLIVGEFARGIVVVSSTGTGDHSTLSVTGETRIGDGANGFLTLHSATMTNIGDLRVGLFNNPIASTLTADLFSTLNVQGAIEVGVTGLGTLNVSGSQATCDTLIVGGAPPSAGRVNVTNAAELTVSGNAQVGVSSGYGEITIDEFSSLHLNGTMTIGGPVIGFGFAGTGKVIVNGTIDGGGVVVVVPNGRLEGNGTVITPKVEAGGYIDPGLSPGSLTIDGDLEILPGGALTIEYEGLDPGDFDTLHVTGDTTLDGRLEVHFRGGFSPDDPAAFIQSQDFIEADGGTTGDYAERIYAFPDLFADFDDDGDKDLKDAGKFQNCFGLSGGGLQPNCARADWEDNGVLNEVDVKEFSSRLTGPE